MLSSRSFSLLFAFLIVFYFYCKYSGHVWTSDGSVLYKTRTTNRMCH